VFVEHAVDRVEFSARRGGTSLTVCGSIISRVAMRSRMAASLMSRLMSSGRKSSSPRSSFT
jgi:hypothetical protein